ncbi:MDR family MFS transporter [Aneurinibacillus aneurinilyticus]|uniref:MDR family MFS transporter n=1 Tax=Aneurinibacillus aneurinilyticus TaxID=1391 RepID=UPI00399D26E5
MKKTNIRITVVGLLLALLLVSLDSTILATAVPTIVAKLGGLEQMAWVFSAYLIASVAGMPVFGKLSDMYGRKLFFLTGLILFLLGSGLCGSARTMVELIVYRAIQGIGGGALMPVIFTIIYDIFPPEKRGKMQGLFGAVFGLSSVLGPLAGAFFIDYIHWRWIFFINLPLGFIALLMILLCYHESLGKSKQKIDWAGTAAFIASIVCLMFTLEMGARDYAWNSPFIVGLSALSAILLLLFVWIERKVSDPLVPLSLFKNNLFASSMAIGFLYGMVLMAGASYIPLFVQGVFGGSATNAGTIITPMMIGLVISSVLGGVIVRRTAYRNVMLCSVAFLLTSLCLLCTISAETERWVVTCSMILMGLGIGASYPVTSMAAQHRIEFQQRGTVNSLVRFSQSVGNTMGIVVLGGLQSGYLKRHFAAILPDPTMADRFGNPQVLLQDHVRQTIPPALLGKLTGVLADSISLMFQWAIPIGVLAGVFILLMGKTRMYTLSDVREKKRVSP